ncbi:MAG: hypothetical protein ACKVW3_11385 [Phycisphaerales bacterium]
MKLLDILSLVPIAVAVFLLASPARAQCGGRWLPGEGLEGLNGHIYALVNWDPDGSGPLPPVVVVGGSFTVAGTALASNIAVWDGSVWTTLGAGMNNLVQA